MSVNPNETEGQPEGQNPNQNQPDYSNNALWKKAGGDWNKAGDSYFNAVQELSRVHEAAKAAEMRAAQLEGALAQLTGGGTPANQDPFAELEQVGVSPDLFRRGVASLIQNEVAQLFQPVLSQVQAEEQLSNEIENFDQLKAEARLHMRQNPEVAEVFNSVKAVKPADAWKYAIRETLIAKAAAERANPNAPTNRSMGSRTQPNRGDVNTVADHNKVVDEALEYGRQSGDLSPYLHARSKGTSIETAVRRALEQIGLPAEADIEGW